MIPSRFGVTPGSELRGDAYLPAAVALAAEALAAADLHPGAENVRSRRSRVCEEHRRILVGIQPNQTRP